MKTIKNIKLMLLGLLALGSMNAWAVDYKYAIKDGVWYKYQTDAAGFDGTSAAKAYPAKVYGVKINEDDATTELTIPASFTWTSPADKTEYFKVVGFTTNWAQQTNTTIEGDEVEFDASIIVTLSTLTVNIDNFDAAGFTPMLNSLKRLTSLTLSDNKMSGNNWTPTAFAMADFAIAGTQAQKTLTTLNLAKVGVTTIPASYFAVDATNKLWTKLTSLTLPNRLETISATALKGFKGTAITLPGSVTEIGANAFQNVTGITSITIPAATQTIGANAFDGCTGLTSVTFATYTSGAKNGKSDVTTINANAFKGCTKLTSIDLSNTAITDGLYAAFTNCTGITSVTLSDDVTTLRADLFASTKIEEITALGATHVYTVMGAPSKAKPNTTLKKVTLGPVEVLSPLAFQYCTALEEVTIDFDSAAAAEKMANAATTAAGAVQALEDAENALAEKQEAKDAADAAVVEAQAAYAEAVIAKAEADAAAAEAAENSTEAVDAATTAATALRTAQGEAETAATALETATEAYGALSEEDKANEGNETVIAYKAAVATNTEKQAALTEAQEAKETADAAVTAAQEAKDEADAAATAAETAATTAQTELTDAVLAAATAGEELQDAEDDYADALANYNDDAADAITFADGLLIPAKAFYYCTALTTFNFSPTDADYKYVNDNAFLGCSSNPLVHFVTTTIYQTTFPNAPFQTTYGNEAATTVTTKADAGTSGKFFAKFTATSKVSIDPNEAKVYSVYVDEGIAYFQGLAKKDKKYVVFPGENVIIKTDEEKEVEITPYNGTVGQSSVLIDHIWSLGADTQLADFQEANMTAGEYLYRLTNNAASGGFGFTYFTGATMKAGQFFIISTVAPAAGGRIYKQVWLDEDGNVENVDETTGIGAIATENVAEGVIYNMAGQKVDNNYKGVVIKNGKKVILK